MRRERERCGAWWRAAAGSVTWCRVCRPPVGLATLPAQPLRHAACPLTACPLPLRSPPPLARLAGRVQVEQDWIAPMMPVVYPEECEPGGWQEVQPACDRGQRWVKEEPPAVVGTGRRQSFCIQVRAGLCCGLEAASTLGRLAI